MKRINYGINNVLRSLSRKQLKDITGGDGPGTKPECYDTQPCMLVYTDQYNISTTFQGRCDTGASGCYCRFDKPVPLPLTSNGGVSRCTKPPM
ncbi:hypothetical protein [Chryseobacterium gleum]|uniref:hypothetical protein n=1 Tax=Chryseobacterium gleum TaxID=250 RepID=UPI00241E86B0|nr:hypothetical protein [Chryseobacterium gleum]